MTKKKPLMHWIIFKYFKKQVAKNFIQKFICMLSFFVEKGRAVLFQSNPFGS